MARTTDDSEENVEHTIEFSEIKDRLKLSEETVAILRSSNSQLDKHLVSVKSDFSVLETLLIESGQTLQRLQEMVSLLLLVSMNLFLLTNYRCLFVVFEYIDELVSLLIVFLYPLFSMILVSPISR
jgi:magnesium-transporting ATPase (P-type)